MRSCRFLLVLLALGPKNKKKIDEKTIVGRQLFSRQNKKNKNRIQSKTEFQLPILTIEYGIGQILSSIQYKLFHGSQVPFKL